MRRAFPLCDLDVTVTEFDADGYLLDRQSWTQALAHKLAAEHQLTLTDAHWEIIELVRQFHADTDVVPAMRPLVTLVKRALGPEQGNSLYLHGLFPDSPAKLVAKLAGLPKPTNCL